MGENRLKAALAAGEMQLGCWLNLGAGGAAELAGLAGFDWALIDGEHGPWDIAAIQDQLRALASVGQEAVVRVPVGEPWVIKQVLDIGATSVLVPMVDSAGAARRTVAACRYPPAGIRGMGAAVARASMYGHEADYTAFADRRICVMVQAESRAALDDLDAIAATEGVDVVFIGPADLSADMGHPGNPGAPEVRAAIEDAVGRIRAAGKVAGIFDYDRTSYRRYRELGVRFLAVAGDATLLRLAMAEAARSARAALG